MKRLLISATTIALALTAMRPADAIISREGKRTIINTTQLAADVEGFNGTTPLKIYILNGKIEKIEALQNQETPKYFNRVRQQLLQKWNGMTVSKAMKAKIDGATGATFSSKAVKENVKRGLKYYKEKK